MICVIGVCLVMWFVCVVLGVLWCDWVMFFCWVWFGDDDVWVLLGVYVDVMVVDWCYC